MSYNTESPQSSPIIFDNVLLNPGDNYDATVGIYTVPMGGIYEFYAQIESYEDSNNNWWFNIFVDGNDATLTRHDTSGSSATTERVSASFIVLLELSAGQQVWVETPNLDALHGTSSPYYSWFSAQLIIAI